MSLSDKAKNIFDIAAAGLHGLETAGDIATGLLGLNPKVDEGLKVIVAIVDAVRGGLDGTKSVEDVKDQLQEFESKSQALKDKIAAEIDATFPQ